MSTLSVPLTPELEKFIKKMVEAGVASNKADVARKALEYYAQEMAVQAVLQSEQEAREGKILRGDLDELTKKI